MAWYLNPVVRFAVQLFFIACAIWLASIVGLAVRSIHRPRPFSIKGLLLFVAVAAITTAMAAALLRNSS
jgi:hypothetical protein